MELEKEYTDSLMKEIDETLSVTVETINKSRASRGVGPVDLSKIDAGVLDTKSPMSRAPTEATVLGAIMILGRKRLPAEVAQLSAECFTQPTYAYIWQAIDACMCDGMDCDEVTVWDRIKKDDDGPHGIAYDFHTLTATCPSTANLDHWAKTIIEDSAEKRREARLAEILADTNLDSATKSAEVQRELLGIETRGNGIKKISDLITPWFNELEKEKQDPDRGRVAKTGIPSLDFMTKLKAGEMTIIAGRPGMGKSALAGCIAGHNGTRANGDVAMFSLEMTATAVIGRLVTNASGVNVSDEIKDAGWPKIANALGRMKSLGLWIDDRSGLSASDMRASLMRIPKVSLIIVDYLGLMAHSKNAQRHDLAVGMNTKEIRSLAKDFGAHAIVLCQLNRKVEERKPAKPMLSDLRDSGNIEEDSDNVWLVYREGYYNTDAKIKNNASINIAKQRHGKTGEVFCKWDGNTQRFYDEAKESF